MKVIVVDDDRNFTRDLVEFLRSENYESRTFHTVEEARQGLAGLDEPVLVLLDHDFGPNEQGYALCRWLRESHPFGLLLPVIYLTGRETPDRFLSREADDPFTHPTAFLTKNQLAEDDGLLPRLLKQYQEQFERIRGLSEQQGARQAIIGLMEMDPEFIDAP